MKEIVQQMKAELWEIFDHLHRHPEISWEEWQTTEFLRRELEREGYRARTFADCPGVVAEIGAGPFTVGVRSDMDALWQEVDGVWQPNHACGHDAHMTIVLGVAKLLRRIGYEPPGTLRFLFQPAEEKGTGALKMIEKGAADGLTFLYGVHLRPIQEVKGGYASPAIIHGAAQCIEGRIRGVAAHAARPHLGVNVIEVGSAIVQELGKIHIDPQVPASIKMTKFHAGEKDANTIPDYAEFALDLRAQTNEAMERLVEGLRHVINGVAAIYGADIELVERTRIVAAHPDPDAVRLMEEAIITTLGTEKCVPPVVTSGGEDFHFYSFKKPELKTTMLGLGCDLRPGLHHPNMTFRRDDLLSGVEILARVVMNTFATFAPQGRTSVPLSLQIIETIEQLKEMARLEEEIWKTAPVPLHQTLTVAKNGGIIIGAYVDGKLVGFVYSFPGFRNGEVYLCSHMMGIAESFRDRGLGYRLKMKQAEEARRRGYRVIRWTYDPLQSRNGYLNLAKLGALGVEYVENCYGEMNDALNGQLPSDRFIVEWRLDERPTGERSLAKADLLKARSLTVLEAGQRADGLLRPVLRDIDETAAPLLLAAVPLDFPQLKERDLALALEWRLTTRALFQRLLMEGWIAASAWRRSGEPAMHYIWVRRNEWLPQKGEEE